MKKQNSKKIEKKQKPKKVLKPKTPKKTKNLEEFVCNFTLNGTNCGIPFANAEDLNAHGLTHVPNPLYECSNCTTKFPSIQDLKLHVDQQTCFENKRIEEIESSTNQIEKEKETETKEAEKTPKINNFIRCSICQFLAKNKKGIVKHMMNSHFSAANESDDDDSKLPPGPKSRKKRQKCKNCKETFSNLTVLNSHMRKCENK